MTTTEITDEVGGIASDAALVRESRQRIQPVADADRQPARSGLLTGGSFLLATTAWLVFAPPRSVPFGVVVACIATYVVAGCVEFEIGPGCALPTTPVQIVMLFLLPPPLVPVAVFAGLVISSHVARLWDPDRRERVMVLAGSSWQVVGPAAVFAVAHVSRPSVSDWAIYALALAAEFGFDAAASWLRNRHELGVPTRPLASALRFTFACDLLLAPAGFAAALALPGSVGALALLLPLTVLLAVLQSDRRKQIDQTIALGLAFTDTRQLARRDPLTGVANRLAFEEALARYEHANAAIGVVLADVDGLKHANDTHGHTVGDELLVAVASLLADAAATEPGATVFRIGGDEFAFLVPLATTESMHALATLLQHEFEAAPANDHGVPVSASVGVGFAVSGLSIGPAIATADHAVNREKVRRGLRRC